MGEARVLHARFAVFVALLLGGFSLPTPPGASADVQWLAPVSLSSSRAHLLARPAVTPAGETLVLFFGGLDPGPVELAVKKPNAQAFDPPVVLSPNGAVFYGRLSVAADGTAAMVWNNGGRVEGTVRGPDGSLAAVRTLASGTSSSLGGLVSNPAGQFAVGYTSTEATERAMVAEGSAGTGFGAGRELGSAYNVTAPELGLDDAGDATAVWNEQAAENGPYVPRSARQRDGAWASSQELAGSRADVGVSVNPEGDAVVLTSDAHNFHVLSSNADETTFSREEAFSEPGYLSPFFARVDAGGSAVVGWTESPNSTTTEGSLITVARGDLGSPFAGRQEYPLPAWAYGDPPAQNRAGDIVGLLTGGAYPELDATLVWRTGPASFALQSFPLARELQEQDVLLDERGDALALTITKTVGCPCFGAYAYWRPADGASFSRMNAAQPPEGTWAPGFDGAIALNAGHMLFAGSRYYPGNPAVTWVRSGTAEAGFGTAQVIGREAQTVLGAAIRNDEDASVFSVSAPALWATVRAPVTEPPPPPPPGQESGPTPAAETGVTPRIEGPTLEPALPTGGPAEEARPRASRLVRIEGAVVEARIRCPAGGPACAGEARLIGPVRAARARGRTALARGRFRVPAGTSRRIKLRLTPRGRQVLRGHRRVHARLEIRDATGAPTSTTPVVIRTARH